jgi:glycosyltransferase involved in cell wall biosynthesis
MKILHFCSYYRPFGGAERLLFTVLDVLEKHGLENVIVAPEAQSGGLTGKRKEYFVDYLEYPFGQSDLFSSLSRNRRLVSAIKQIVEKEHPDVIHLHNQQNPFVYYACVSTGRPLVRNVHDPRLYCPTNWRLLPDKSLCPYPFGRACVKQGCVKWTPAEIKHLAFMIFHRQLSFKNTTFLIESRESYNLAIQNGYKQDQLYLIPNFTTLQPMDVEMECKRKNKVPGENSLLFVGRASYEKGLHFLLESLPHVRNEFKLYILTSGDYFHRKIAPLIQSLGLSNRVEVRMDTSYEETARFYSMADVAIVPSIWFETFCLVGIEAFSHLTPVIGTRTGGIKDWCVDGETGFLVNMFDTKGMAKAVDTLLDDQEMRAQFGRNGYLRVQRHYADEVYFERLVQLYERLRGNGKGNSN